MYNVQATPVFDALSAPGRPGPRANPNETIGLADTQGDGTGRVIPADPGAHGVEPCAWCGRWIAVNRLPRGDKAIDASAEECSNPSGSYRAQTGRRLHSIVGRKKPHCARRELGQAPRARGVRLAVHSGLRLLMHPAARGRGWRRWVRARARGGARLARCGVRMSRVSARQRAGA